MLGVDPEEKYTQSILQLVAGDTLLLYTDGLPDALNFRDTPYGRQRILDAFAQGGDTAEQVAQNILWDLRKFIGLTKRTDDVTLMVVKVK